MASLAIPLITSGISAIAGLFGGKPKPTTTTTNSNSNTTSNQSGSSTTTPQLSDLQQLLSNTAGYGALNKYNGNSSQSLIDSIKTAGLQSINNGSQNQQKITSNILASRGLAYSPYAAGALQNPESQRIGQQSQLLQQLPALKQQFDDSNFNNLLSAFKALPTGSQTIGNSSGSSSTTGSQTTVGTPPDQSIPGLLSGLGAGLAAPAAGGSNLSSILASLGIKPTSSGGNYGVNSNGSS